MPGAVPEVSPHVFEPVLLSMAAFWPDAWLYVDLLQPGVFVVQRTSYTCWTLREKPLAAQVLSFGRTMGISRELGQGIFKDCFGLSRVGEPPFSAAPKVPV